MLQKATSPKLRGHLFLLQKEELKMSSKRASASQRIMKRMSPMEQGQMMIKVKKKGTRATKWLTSPSKSMIDS